MSIDEKTITMLLDFGQQIIIALIMFLLGWIGQKIYEQFSKIRPARRVWKLQNEGVTYIVTPNPTGYYEKEFSHTVFPTDYRAVEELKIFLAKIYPKMYVEEYFAEELPSQFIGKNLILIGGAEINPVTDIMFRKLTDIKSPLSFDDDNINCTYENSQTKYSPELLLDTVTKRNELVTDYAMVLSASNPFSETNRVVVFAGCYVHGNLAAVLSMTGSQVRKINKFAKKSDQFSYLLKASVLRRYIGSLRIEEAFIYDKSASCWIRPTKKGVMTIINNIIQNKRRV